MTWFRKDVTAHSSTSSTETTVSFDPNTVDQDLSSLLETLDGGEGWTQYTSHSEGWWFPGVLGHRFRVLENAGQESVLCLDVVLFQHVLQTEQLFEDLNRVNSEAGCWWVWYDSVSAQVVLSSHASLRRAPVFSRVRGALWSVEASYAAEALVAEWAGRFVGQVAYTHHPVRGSRPERDGWLQNEPTTSGREGTSALPVVVTNAERELVRVSALATAPSVSFASSETFVLEGTVDRKPRLVVLPWWDSVMGYGLRSVVSSSVSSLQEIADLNRDLAQPHRRFERALGAGGYVMTAAGACFTTFVAHFTLENWASNDFAAALTHWAGVGLLAEGSHTLPDPLEWAAALLATTSNSTPVLGDEAGLSSEEPLLSLLMINNVLPFVVSYRLAQHGPTEWALVQHTHNFSYHRQAVLCAGTRDTVLADFSRVIAETVVGAGLPLPCAAHARSEHGKDALFLLAMAANPAVLAAHVDAHVLAGPYTASLLERVASRTEGLPLYEDTPARDVSSRETARHWVGLVSSEEAVSAATLHLRVATEGAKAHRAGTDSSMVSAAVQDLQLRRMLRQVAMRPEDWGAPDSISWEEVLLRVVSPLLVLTDSVTYGHEWAALTLGPLSIRVGIEQRLADDPSVIRVTSTVSIATIVDGQPYTGVQTALQPHCGVGALGLYDGNLQSFVAARLTPSGRYVLQSFAGWVVAQLDEAAHLWRTLTSNRSMLDSHGLEVLTAPLPTESFNTALYGPPMSGGWLPERWRTIRQMAVQELTQSGVPRGYENYEVTFLCETIPDLAMELINTPRVQFIDRHGPGLLLRARVLPPAGTEIEDEEIAALCATFNSALQNSSEHFLVGFSPLGCSEYGLSMTAYMPAYVVGPEWFSDEMLAGSVYNAVRANLASVHFVGDALR
jgi:hypothetical protein